jgi:hypothetical protein
VTFREQFERSCCGGRRSDEGDRRHLPACARSDWDGGTSIFQNRRSAHLRARWSSFTLGGPTSPERARLRLDAERIDDCAPRPCGDDLLLDRRYP